jgi:hypothetical protein
MSFASSNEPAEKPLLAARRCRPPTRNTLPSGRRDDEMNTFRGDEGGRILSQLRQHAGDYLPRMTRSG